MVEFEITHIVTETTTREEHSSLWDVDSTTNSSHAKATSVTTPLELNISLTMGRKRGKQAGT
jgi:hypothetical protein